MHVINTLKPRSFDDVQLVANALREHRPVILNFENTTAADKKRFIDFISGSIQAINGDINSVNEDVYICTPPNVSVDAVKNNS